MPRQTHLAATLRGAGLEVIEVPGWQTRGADRLTPQGVVAHHTATGATVTDDRVAALLERGRDDLPGPLSQLGLDRRGRFWVIAAGRANHNGFGTWANDCYGIEAFNSGVGEPWPAAQVEAYQRGCAALCRFHLWGADRVKGHKETDPKRKIDPAGIDMGQFRASVAWYITHPQPIEDDEMSAEDVRKINEKLERQDKLIGDIHMAVYGHDLPQLGDDNPRHQSIFTGVKYMRAEVIGGKREDPNSPISIWHRIQAKFKTPETTTP